MTYPLSGNKLLLLFTSVIPTPKQEAEAVKGKLLIKGTKA